MSESPVPDVGFFPRLPHDYAIGITWGDNVYYRKLVGEKQFFDAIFETLPQKFPNRLSLKALMEAKRHLNNYIVRDYRRCHGAMGMQNSGFVSRSTFETSGIRFLMDDNRWYYSHHPYVTNVPLENAMDDAFCFDIEMCELENGDYHVSPDVLFAAKPPAGMPTWGKFRKFLRDNDIETPDFPTQRLRDEIIVNHDIASFIRLAYPITHIYEY